MKPRHVAWNAFFVTLFLTIVYAIVMGFLIAGLGGFIYAPLFAAVPAFFAGIAAAPAYWFLGRALLQRGTPSGHAKRWSAALGALLGPALATCGLLAVFHGSSPVLTHPACVPVAVAVGWFGGSKIWGCAESHARTAPDLFEPR